MYTDPSPDPDFPERPDHEDFRLLSNTAQGIDMLSEVQDIEEIFPFDKDSALYYIEQRLGILGERIGVENLDNPMIMALYLDALAVGALGERARHNPPPSG